MHWFWPRVPAHVVPDGRRRVLCSLCSDWRDARRSSDNSCKTHSVNGNCVPPIARPESNPKPHLLLGPNTPSRLWPRTHPPDVCAMKKIASCPKSIRIAILGLGHEHLAPDPPYACAAPLGLCRCREYSRDARSDHPRSGPPLR
ncbi:hypothetical protein RV134_350096 [Roseovarius sp. EC-HK134]|nr:hypothetical protein RV420_400373 [Roseovarius sp. EC-SD190]VVT28175.1 hypothetical protein RV134_350096 [Roseovarius sp. EC-HK134]